MSKQEFLDELRISLTDQVEQGVIRDNLKYYEEYINGQTRQGRLEEEVLAELGSPRLIARTIIETNKPAEENEQGSYQHSYRANQGSERNYETEGSGRHLRWLNMPVWLIIAVAVLILLPVLSLVVMFISWLAPLIITIWLIMLIIRIFRGLK